MLILFLLLGSFISTRPPMTASAASGSKALFGTSSGSGRIGSDAILNDPCENDDYEPDNTYTEAKWISPDGIPQAHVNTPPDLTEEDWVKFDAIAGHQYEIRTRLTNDIDMYDGAANDTLLYLYDRDGTTPLAFNDDVDPNSETWWYNGYYHYRESIISWTAPASGTFYARELQWGPTYVPPYTIRDCHSYIFWVVDLTTTPMLSLTKTSTTTLVTSVGQVVDYSYLLTNTTNLTLTGISLADNNIDSSNPSCPQDSLMVGFSMTCTASHTVTQSEMDTGGNLTNIATASSEQSSPISSQLSIPTCSGSLTTLTGGSDTDGPWTLSVPATSAPTGSCVTVGVRDAGGEPAIGAGVKSLGHFAQGRVVAPDGSSMHSFTPPLTICYHYTHADLVASGYNPLNISLGTEEDGVHWTMLAANADPATKTICAKTSHLSYFELFLPARLPATGFAPGRVTFLPARTTTYQQMGDVWLEIPRLSEQVNIEGVPFSTDGWDVSWLGDNAGWLENTTLPGVAGNSVLTGHVTNALGQPGPFAGLNQMWYGDQIILHAWGQEYIYEVRSVELVSSVAVSSVMTHKTLSWLTLVTCKGYNDTSNSYDYRVAVQAVLVQVK